MPWESLRSVWDASQRRHASGRSTLLENWAANSSSMMGDGLYIVLYNTSQHSHTQTHTDWTVTGSNSSFSILPEATSTCGHQGPGIKPPTSQFWTMALPSPSHTCDFTRCTTACFSKNVSQKGVSTLLKYASSLFWVEAAASCKEQIEQGRKSDTQKNGNEPLPSRRNSRERNHLTLQRV